MATSSENQGRASPLTAKPPASPPAPRCHHNSSCNHGRETNWPRVLPWGTPEAESKPGKNPHGISWLISTAKENKNDLASDQCREPRKQKHDPGDEKRNETSGGPSRRGSAAQARRQANTCCWALALGSPLSSPGVEREDRRGEQVNRMQPSGSKPVPALPHSASAGARLLQSRVYTAGEMRADSKPPRPDPPTPFFSQSIGRPTAHTTTSTQVGPCQQGHRQGPLGF